MSNIQHAEQQLHVAQLAARSTDPALRASGNALVAYWQAVLCQLGAIVWTDPSKVELLEPGWDNPQSPWLHERRN